MPFGILEKSPTPYRFCSVVKAQWSVATTCSVPAANPAHKLVTFVSLDKQLALEPDVYIWFESEHRLSLEKKALTFKTEEEFLMAADMNWYRYDAQKKCGIIQAKSAAQMQMIMDHTATIRFELNKTFYRFRAWPATTATALPRP